MSKRIVITGAGAGIGLETALALAANHGAEVLAIGRSAARLENLVQGAKDRGVEKQIHLLAFDLVGGGHEHALLPAIKDVLGAIDALINNAGQLINKPFEKLDVNDFRGMVESNLLIHVQMIKSLMPHFNPLGCHVVNIGSMGGFQGSQKFPGLAAYSVAKSALHTLTECLAEEYKHTRWRFNCLALGAVQTDMLNQAFPGFTAPVTAVQMGAFIADFAVKGHDFFNGKILPVALTSPS